jgi:hypothetical protein
MVQNPTPYSIKATDMTDEMQAEVIALATEAVSTHVHARDIAQRCVLTAPSPPVVPTPVAPTPVVPTPVLPTPGVRSRRIKKEMDSRSGGGSSWHCIVGQDFGSYVTHEAKHFIYFYVNKLGVLLFKSG